MFEQLVLGVVLVIQVSSHLKQSSSVALPRERRVRLYNAEPAIRRPQLR